MSLNPFTCKRKIARWVPCRITVEIPKGIHKVPRTEPSTAQSHRAELPDCEDLADPGHSGC